MLHMLFARWNLSQTSEVVKIFSRHGIFSQSLDRPRIFFFSRLDALVSSRFFLLCLRIMSIPQPRGRVKIAPRNSTALCVAQEKDLFVYYRSSSSGSIFYMVADTGVV